MVDLRVDVIWTTCKDDTMATIFFHPLKSLFTFYLNIFSCYSHFIPTGLSCFYYFLSRNLRKLFYES